jgi:hypothetical protein
VGDDLWDSVNSVDHIVGESSVLGSYPWLASESEQARNPSSPEVSYELYDDPAVIAIEMELESIPLVEFLWKTGLVAEMSSAPWNVNSLNTWSSMCCVGVNKSELAGLFDLPVTSDLADDI